LVCVCVREREKRGVWVSKGRPAERARGRVLPSPSFCRHRLARAALQLALHATSRPRTHAARIDGAGEIAGRRTAKASERVRNERAVAFFRFFAFCPLTSRSPHTPTNRSRTQLTRAGARATGPACQRRARTRSAAPRAAGTASRLAGPPPPPTRRAGGPPGAGRPPPRPGRTATPGRPTGGTRRRAPTWAVLLGGGVCRRGEKRSVAGAPMRPFFVRRGARARRRL
jgi:hypothetical protein